MRIITYLLMVVCIFAWMGSFFTESKILQRGLLILSIVLGLIGIGLSAIEV